MITSGSYKEKLKPWGVFLQLAQSLGCVFAFWPIIYSKIFSSEKSDADRYVFYTGDLTSYLVIDWTSLL